MKKGLLALQYWHGDAPKAARLANFISSLEPPHADSRKRMDVDFLFLARHDSFHDTTAVAKMARRFTTFTHNTPTPARGHPWAAWVMWHSIAEWVNQQKQQYEFVFTFEADCVPITKNWISDLREAWDNREPGTYVLGSETFHWEHHINGNLMYSGSPTFVRWLLNTVGRRGVPQTKAWDVFMFPQFAALGAGFTHRIWNCCGQPTFSREMYQDALKRGVSIVHGCKDDSLFNFSKEALTGNAK